MGERKEAAAAVEIAVTYTISRGGAEIGGFGFLSMVDYYRNYNLVG